ncbi:MAG: hypothetical protein AMXMBFR13_34910 [Phycisphaerae bacterium]
MSTQAPTLYCPHCRYNLTGLPENRCPECGTGFDPERLAARHAMGPQPISLEKALLYSALLPGGLWLVTFCAPLLNGTISLILFLLLLPWLMFGPVWAILIFQRLFAAHAAQSGVRPWDVDHPVVTAILGLALFAVQILVGLIPLGFFLMFVAIRS